MVAQLLCLSAGGGRIVKLHRAECRGSCAFHLKEEQGTANGDLIAGTEDALLDGNAVDERAGRGVQVSEQEAFILAGDLAVEGRDRRIFDANWIGGVSADRQRRGEPEFRFSEGAGESKGLSVT